MILTGDLNVAWEEIDIYDPKGHKRQAGFTDRERASFSSFMERSGFIDTYRMQNPEKV